MSELNPTTLLAILKRRDITLENAFEVLRSLCGVVSSSDSEYENSIQELVLRALDQRSSFGRFSVILDGLARQLGLYPYMSEDLLTANDAIAREFHRPSNFLSQESANQTQRNDDDSFVFHRAQALVFRKLLDGESIILSAPTSFGKSSIVDALIGSGKFRNVVIVVPTIALIDETRRRLAKFRSTHKIITHASQAPVDANVFVLTQERVVDYLEFPALDLFVLDEFYKLDPVADKERSATLNHAFYRLSRKARQFYLLGPNIQHIPEGFPKRFRCQFIRTDFTTVVTELIPVKPPKGLENERLVELCVKLEEATLIYCASPAKARKIVQLLCDSGIQGEGMLDAAEWIGENYHQEWTVVRGLKSGIGMHHGRMPRALAQLAVKGFNDGKLRFLVCTSTLIEGVNTKAKNV